VLQRLLTLVSSVQEMASTEVIKKDFMLKRSQMKGRLKSENYRYRWFELTASVLRYSDGSLEVRLSYIFD